jgi:hypothetical protein
MIKRVNDDIFETTDAKNLELSLAQLIVFIRGVPKPKKLGAPLRSRHP